VTIPFVFATGAAGAQTGKILISILVILVAAKLAAEFAERIGIPAVAGEIVAGIAIGPSVLGLVEPNEILSVLGELGVILLLLEVGMHMDLRELRSVGRNALSVAVVGVVVPFLSALAIGPVLGFSGDQALFLGAALTATSVGITARVFGDLRALASREAQTVLGAAVADDVIGLIVLTVVVRLVTGTGSVSLFSVGGIVLMAVGFLVVCTILGLAFVPRILAFIDRQARSNATLFALALAFALGVSQLATVAKLAPIIGAFVAGMAIGRSPSSTRIQRELTPVGHLFIPVFFLQIGINVDVATFGKPRVLGIALVLSVIAIVGKLVSGWSIRGTFSSKLLIGIGMIPRGEVGLIFAAIGLREGVFDNELYAALLLTVLITTLITPPLLGAHIKRARASAAIAGVDVTPEPADGWVQVRKDVVTLVGSPPSDQLIPITLRAGLGVQHAQPAPELVQWISAEIVGSASASPRVAPAWNEPATAMFLDFLRTGSARSWRFLETTGFLGYALPELDQFLHDRRMNPSVLDATGLSGWPLLERVRRLQDGIADHPGENVVIDRFRQVRDRDRLLLAALLIDATGSGPDRARVLRSFLDRLKLDDETRECVAMLVTESELLRAASLRSDGLREESVLRIAAHLGTRENADALYVITLAMNSLEDWERALVNQLDALIHVALEGPLFVGRNGSIVDQRKAEVVQHLGTSLPDSRHLVDRVEHAPMSYVLNTDAASIARHVQLLSTLRPKGQFSVSVHPVDGSHESEYSIEIGGRDAIGLLARTTGVLGSLGLDINDAMIATWGDGAALQVFRAHITSGLPSTDEISTRLAVAPNRLQSLGIADAAISFDEHASPWHTVAEVSATDRRGLLHALAVTFASVGVDVHAARISTTDEMAHDSFDLTDRTGNKLSREAQEAIRIALRTGVTGTRSHLAGRRIRLRNPAKSA
jgi:Kef-type K+ transport system membrane component KefB